MVSDYSHQEHYETVKKWLSHYGIEISPKSFFSSIGYVVNNVAVGFLYTTDSSKAFIDQIAADPLVSKSTRNEALDLLITTLTKRAIDEGAEIVQVFTTPPLSNRFVDHGYKDYGQYTLLIK